MATLMAIAYPDQDSPSSSEAAISTAWPVQA